MPRILGVDIPAQKRLIIALTYIYGIGPKKATEVIKKLSLNPDMRAKEMSEAQISSVNKLLQDEYTVEGDLRRQVQANIKRLMTIRCYRGIRHQKGLPCRGQKTQNNARTRKGKKKTVANKKK